MKMTIAIIVFILFCIGFIWSNIITKHILIKGKYVYTSKWFKFRIVIE